MPATSTETIKKPANKDKTAANKDNNILSKTELLSIHDLVRQIDNKIAGARKSLAHGNIVESDRQLAEAEESCATLKQESLPKRPS